MAVAKWTSDPSHSEIQFKIKNLLISTVTGFFKKLDVAVETNGDDFTNAAIRFTAVANSIDTNNEQRDEHLKAPEFFDTVKYSTITFDSTKMEKVDAETYILTGTLTIKGVSKSVILDVEFGGIVEKDRFGQTRAGFSLNGKINRHDFGIGPVNPGLGDEIKLHSSLQIVKQV